MVLNATFNNMFSYIMAVSFILEETGVPVENNRPVVSQWQTLSHNILSSTHCHELYNICEFI